MDPKATVAAVEQPATHLKRALSVWDLTWLSVVATANLNVVPVIAASGPTTIWLWLAALLFFFLPQGIGVIELSHRFPSEGGVYVWTKEMFGDLHGFLCGWCYWVTNMFFIPTLLFYLVGIATYMGGATIARLGENSLVFGGLAIGLLWVTTIANIFGVGIGKWVSNIGGLGTLSAAAILIILGVISIIRFGITVPTGSFRFRGIDWSVVSSFGVICFALVGLELGCVMGDEIRDPQHTVPRGVFYGGTLTGLQYLGVTLAILVAVPQSDMKVVQGVVQAVDKMGAKLGTEVLLFPVAALVVLSTIGSVSAWLSGSARILFVSGIDQYLPRAFGKLHNKYATPHVALIGMSVLSSCLIAMSFAGESTIKEAYVTLIDLAVVLQMISYFYVYASLARVAFGQTAGTGFYSKGRIRFAAISGLLTTTVGTVVAFVPSHQVESVRRFEIKMFATCALFLGMAVALFFYYSRHKMDESAVAAGA